MNLLERIKLSSTLMILKKSLSGTASYLMGGFKNGRSSRPTLLSKKVSTFGPLKETYAGSFLSGAPRVMI